MDKARLQTKEEREAITVAEYAAHQVNMLKARIDVLTCKIDAIRETCPHPTVKRTGLVRGSEFDRTDHYVTHCWCVFCGKRWEES